jgi:hypothetical protein
VLILRGCAAEPFKAQDGVPHNAIWGRACIEIKFTCQEEENVDCPADMKRSEVPLGKPLANTGMRLYTHYTNGHPRVNSSSTMGEVTEV